MKNIDLAKIFDSMKENDISELIIKDGSRLYEIRRGGIKQNFIASQIQPQANIIPQVSNAPVIAAHQSNEASLAISKTAAGKKALKGAGKEENKSDLYEVKSPLVLELFMLRQNQMQPRL